MWLLALKTLSPCNPLPRPSFVERFEGILQRARACTGGYAIAVVGGGAGGVELACALKHR